MRESLGVIGMLLLVILLLALPLFQIWGVNTLFGTGIEYGLAEYFATLAVNTVFATPSKS